MSIHVALNHRTHYRYDRSVSLMPQTIRLRPAPHCRTPILSYSLKIQPAEHFLNWQQDPQGNYLASVVFSGKTREFLIEVDLVAEMAVIDPFEFFLESYVEKYPFPYEPELAQELRPFLAVDRGEEKLATFLGGFRNRKARTMDFLVDLNHHLHGEIGYIIRTEPGIQTCEKTLTSRKGSCRDTAWLLVQLLRQLGLAARFASGYLIQLTPDVKPLEGPTGPATDFTDLHAWAEVYLPGAGWVGLDPTSGLLASEGHIPLACTPTPSSAAPVTGAVERCESEFSHVMSLQRIHESPRVTKPYTEAEWKKIDALGQRIDVELKTGDVRLTMGGEPTFVSTADMTGAEWNTTAVGPDKRRLAGDLLRRLRDRFAPQGLLHHGQGKWYPGESLPRWALGCYWRKDGKPIWRDHHLLADELVKSAYTHQDSERFITTLAEHLKVKPASIMAGYEDAWYYLWREQQLPVTVDVLQSKLENPEERNRLAQIFKQGLKAVAGHTLPLWREHGKKSARWATGPWVLRREHLFLTPGDSPMGYRLPVDSLPKVVSKDWIVHPALCVEPRQGRLYVFVPPVRLLEDYLDLIAAIEETAKQLRLPVLIEGYPPPEDARLEHLRVTPDPGVIEVNIHPSGTWDELVQKTNLLYEEARRTRLGTEKFMLDGRHSGTGGGNHIIIGGATPADSPVLRRPDLLRSILSYWHNHPSLSYLFSGLFIGPTSQAPRVDEARNDSLYELELAFRELPEDGKCSPQMVDRVLRNLLIDVTGNTHRAEFCIDKLYPMENSAGRHGLVELRAFEMPPHARMSLTQHLLLRALIAWFWKEPYRRRLVRWGTELHDRFMLPYFVRQDFQDVLVEMRQAGYALDEKWFAPHFEFRFPLYGSVTYRGVQIELRQAIEPWHVLGEEATAGGAARYVDSSVERLEVKVAGMTDPRHVIACNGRAVPLHPTGTAGEYAAGVRYRAWCPPSALHPTIGINTPLIFDLIDTALGRSVGGCTYHVMHPGGRNSAVFPVNAFEAESRRGARFLNFGHTPGPVNVVPTEPCPEFPLTLDLRRA